MDEQIIVGKTADFVKEKFHRESSGHDWWHIYRVWNLSRKIAKDESEVNLFIVELAALLHDIADWKFNDGDEYIGGVIATKWLKKNCVPLETISKISNIINHISFKGAHVVNKIESLEGMIVQDADRLDAIGAIGIARTFAYGGYADREIYNPEIKPKLHKTFNEYKKSKGHTINHFYEKLLLLKENMHTKAGKKLAEEKHRFMELFLKQFYSEWYYNSDFK